jgi:hypothetical protein
MFARQIVSTAAADLKLLADNRTTNMFCEFDGRVSF